ncbi:MAG: hypothetical protein IIV14_08870 [Bacteroidaceae bacterium]|nr:hypothetical protein [Bacteroidaceae bacterium]
MKKIQTDGLLLLTSIGAFAMMSVSFLLMPIEGLRVIPGLLFWLGLTGGIALQIVLGERCGVFGKSRKNKRKSRIGLLTFGSNTAAKIVDIALLASTLTMTLTFVITKGYGYVCFVFGATTVFTFCMHCVLNGRIYLCVKDKMGVLRVTKSKEEKNYRRRRGRK